MQIGSSYAAPTTFGVTIDAPKGQWGKLYYEVVVNESAPDGFDVRYDYETDAEYTDAEREAGAQLIRQSILDCTLLLPTYIPISDIKGVDQLSCV